MYFFYNYDIRGSVTNIINPDGQIVKGYDYDEFGGTKEKGDYAFKNDVKFTGAVHDKSANLYYMNSRFYNPNTGRFITEDTYSGNAYEPWTQHLYTYTSNNPVNFIDPTGHRAMYAMNPEDETDVQRSTSLNQMKGYSAKDSYKIATAKTPRKKHKAIKTAQENKEAREIKKQQSIENHEITAEAATVINRVTTAASVALTGSSKITREWIVLGKGLEREIPYKALGKFRYGLGLAGISFIAQEIAINTDPTTSEWQKQKLHQSNKWSTGLGIIAGLAISAIPGAGLAILAGVVVSAVLIGGQMYYENKYIYNKH